MFSSKKALLFKKHPSTDDSPTQATTTKQLPPPQPPPKQFTHSTKYTQIFWNEERRRFETRHHSAQQKTKESGNQELACQACADEGKSRVKKAVQQPPHFLLLKCSPISKSCMSVADHHQVYSHHHHHHNSLTVGGRRIDFGDDFSVKKVKLQPVLGSCKQQQQQSPRQLKKSKSSYFLAEKRPNTSSSSSSNRVSHPVYTAASLSPSASAVLKGRLFSSIGASGSIWRPFTPSSRSTVDSEDNSYCSNSLQEGLSPLEVKKPSSGTSKPAANNRCRRQQSTPAKPVLQANIYETPKSQKLSNHPSAHLVLQTKTPRNQKAPKGAFRSPPSPAQLPPPPPVFSSSLPNGTSIVIPPSYTFPRNYLDSKYSQFQCYGYNQLHLSSDPNGPRKTSEILKEKKASKKANANLNEGIGACLRIRLGGWLVKLGRRLLRSRTY